MVFEKKSSYKYEDLIACGEGKLFGQGNAQLPLPNMLMVDNIDEISSTGGKYNNGYVKATLNISPDLWFFACHFKGDPVMPGCLGLDALWQLLGFYLAWSGNKGKGRALGCGEVKFAGQVLDTVKKVEYSVNIKRTFNKDLVLGLADGELYADGKLIYSASGLKVGLFIG